MYERILPGWLLFPPGTECHHVIKRRYKITRHDWRNGILLCADCHRKAHNGLLGVVLPEWQSDYLLERSGLRFKDYLIQQETTEREFLKMQLDENRGICGNE